MFRNDVVSSFLPFWAGSLSHGTRLDHRSRPLQKV